MTTLKKMQDGKAKADERRMRAEDAKARHYMLWLKIEARQHAIYQRLYTMFGRDHPEVVEARAAWRRAAVAIPAIPNDASMKRVRGES